MLFTFVKLIVNPKTFVTFSKVILHNLNINNGAAGNTYKNKNGAKIFTKLYFKVSLLSFIFPPLSLINEKKTDFSVIIPSTTITNKNNQVKNK